MTGGIGLSGSFGSMPIAQPVGQRIDRIRLFFGPSGLGLLENRLLFCRPKLPRAPLSLFRLGAFTVNWR